VVHAFAMHDMSMMTGMDHGGMASLSGCGHDRTTHHMQSDLSIGEPVSTHDGASCITIAKTVSRTTTTIQIIAHELLLAHVVSITHHHNRLSSLDIVTIADIQPPGRSEFLDYHYGHGIVMLS